MSMLGPETLTNLLEGAKELVPPEYQVPAAVGTAALAIGVTTALTWTSCCRRKPKVKMNQSDSLVEELQKQAADANSKTATDGTGAGEDESLQVEKLEDEGSPTTVRKRRLSRSSSDSDE